MVRAFHNICRHRGNKLVWNDFPNEEVQGTCRQFTCKYHAWRFGTRGRAHLRPAGGGVLRPRQGQVRAQAACACEVWEGFIFVNLDDNAEPLERLPRRPDGQGPGGLSLRRDDRGLQLQGRDQLELEAVHRRVRRVLPRTGAAREPGHPRGGREAAELRVRGAALRAARAALAWSRPGAAWRRPRTSTWSSPSNAMLHSGLFGPVGPPRHRGPRSAASGCQPRRGQAVGRRLVRLLPELHAADLGPGLVPDLPLLAHLGATATSSRAACTSCRRRPRATAWARSLRR